jgi:hypothetical protein
MQYSREIAIHRTGETEARYETFMNPSAFNANFNPTLAVITESLLDLIYHDRDHTEVENPAQQMTWIRLTKYAKDKLTELVHARIHFKTLYKKSIFIPLRFIMLIYTLSCHFSHYRHSH